MRLGLSIVAIVVGILGIPAASAQDSVSRLGCLPGDAIAPWDDAFGPHGSEQINDYVVDLTPFVTSWGTTFGLAPLVKASRISSLTSTATIEAQSLSRRIVEDSTFPASSYASWKSPGFGVNGDPSVQFAPASVAVGPTRAHRFAAAFAESGKSSAFANYSGVVTALTAIDRSNPSRLFVRRIQASVNGCSPATDLTAQHLGAVDEDGNVALRTDDASATSQGCGLATLTGSNYFVVASKIRNGSALNVIADQYPNGLFDPGTTSWVSKLEPTTNLNVPNLMPAAVAGGSAIVLGSDIVSEYVRGDGSAPALKDFSHFAPTVTGVKGNLTYGSQNFPLLASTRGIAALLAKTTSSATNAIDVFGLGAAGAVTGAKALQLPATVVDNSTGFANVPGVMQFNHYRSQTFSNGGNGQVALRVDAAGDLLVAAELDHGLPSTASFPSWPTNMLAVARVHGITGATQWTMAAYVDASGSGKPVLDGPGGNAIGHLVPMNTFSSFAGPSVSGPAFDSAGNLWFLAGVHEDATGETATSLLRAVYDAATFSFELERVFKVGDAFVGANSATSFAISDIRIADANSVDSATLWSGNVADSAWLDFDPTCFVASDARSLGGLVIAAKITYDTDANGAHDDCTQVLGTSDESYWTLLYVAAVADSGVASFGSGCAGSAGFVPTLALDGFPMASKRVTLRVRDGLGGTFGILFFGASQGALPIPGSCTLLVSPLSPIQLVLPIGGVGVGQGVLDFPVDLPASVPVGVSFTMQALLSDPGAPAWFSATQGLEVTFQ